MSAQIPLYNDDGSINWQSYTWQEMLNALRKDLFLTSQNIDTADLVASFGGSKTGVPPVRGHRAGALLCSAPGFTKIPLDTVTYDPTGQMVNVSAGRIDIKTSGYYLVTGAAAWGATTATVDVAVFIYKNGSSVSEGNEGPNINNNTNGPARTVTDVIFCNAGDFLELYGYCGVNYSFQPGQTVMFLSAALLAPAPTAILLPTAPGVLSAPPSTRTMKLWGPVDTGLSPTLAAGAEATLTANVTGLDWSLVTFSTALGNLYDGFFAAGFGWRFFPSGTNTVNIVIHSLRSGATADQAGWKGVIATYQ